MRKATDGIALALIFLIFPSLMQAQTKKEDVIVHTSAGPLRGTLQGGTAVFRGVPYALPPIGELRWREPQPVIPWTGIREATQNGNACIQNSSGIDDFLSPLAAAYGARYEDRPLATSEDCLYLNLWVPDWKKQGKLPVMVWLHGGSNVMGSGSQSTYDGTSLASHGVIVVSINYRLGILGFFSHPELTKESPHHSSGNYGLLDQIAALRWVQENIAQFGGDSGNVTLFGESAGAIDAVTLMTSPLARNLFRHVIAESGPGFGPGQPASLAQSEVVGSAIGHAAPATTSSALENLRRMPAYEVVALSDHVIKTQYPDFNSSGTIDGWLLTRSPAQAFALGEIQDADLMAGLNGRELSIIRLKTTETKNASSPKQKSGVGAIAGGLLGSNYPLYGSWTGAATLMYLTKAIFDRYAAIEQLGNDMILACPIGAEATLTSAKGKKAFLYKFERSVPGKGEATLGSFHGLEVPFVFNVFDDPSWRWLPFTDVDRKLSNTIETYWTNFAKTGNPNSSGLTTWPAWTNGEEGYLEFTKNGETISQRSFSPAFCYLSPDRLKRQLLVVVQ